MRTVPARWRALVSLAALAVLSACVDERTPDPVGPARFSEAHADTLSEPEDGDLYPGEAEFRELAEAIPGYAGHWYEDGELVVALTSDGGQEHALEVLGTRPVDEPSSHDEESNVGTRFVEAEYDFTMLREWRDRAADPVLDTDGVTFLDLDEKANRITVGIVSEDARDAAEKALLDADVPAEAVNLVVTGEVEEEQTLQDWVRPLQGGWQIQVPGGLCTLGFTTRNPANGQPAFVTNSHCTATYWGFDGAMFHQNLLDPSNPFANFVGREVRDPAGWRCGWFGLRCRFSDAALVEVTAAAVADGEIARTEWWGFGPFDGSLTVTNPPFTVTGNRWFPSGGRFVDKVGRSTGWTAGLILGTCISTKVRRNILLCQYLASYRSTGGDSGSPVFIRRGETAVELTGLHWGSTGIGRFSRAAIFSPLGGVRRDLGVP